MNVMDVRKKCCGKRGWIPACAGMTNGGAGMTEVVAGMTEVVAGMTNGGAGMTEGLVGAARPFDRLRVSGRGVWDD